MASSRSLSLGALLCAAAGLILLLAGAASGGGVDVGDMLMLDRFRAWQAAFNRTYATPEERLRRFEVYRRNMERIEATNRLGLSYRLGETPFTDLTADEFRATRTMPRGMTMADAVRRRRQLITTRAGPVGGGGGWVSRNWSLSRDDLPESVDWRAQGAVTPAKDQHTCGSCWTFATVAAIEGLHQIVTGELVSLSEQELLDCDNIPPNDGCNGGIPGFAMEWVATNGGLATEADYPYTQVEGECKLDKTTPNRAAKIAGCELVPPVEAALQAAVAQQPVAVVINATLLDNNYVGGVIAHGAPCDPTDTDHAVTVVGYGAEPAGDGGRKYWIVKNSWSEGWGDKGFFLLERDVGAVGGMCGIATLPFYPVM
ncbi:hypothetical protein ACP4OV_018750 [Aristida adscensionis]